MAMSNTSSKVVSMQDTERMKARKEDGLVERGNIDLHNRPVVENKETGGKSTVYSMGIGIEHGREALIPRVSDKGTIMSEKEAIDQFKKSKSHLGIYENKDYANAAAERLHKSQEKKYLSPTKRK